MVSTGEQIGGGGTIGRIQTPAPCAIRFQRLDHQLMGYILSREVWSCLLLCLGLEVLIPYSTSKMFDWWLGSRKLVPKLSRCDFDTLVLLVSWDLWKECNDRTFRHY
jgi:hypothetical protein